MNVTPIHAKEGQLLNLIQQLGELEWRKYQPRYPEIWKKDHWEQVDYSDHPPFVSFRFKHEDFQLIQRLIHAVENYNGKVKWVMVGRERLNLKGTNWCICAKAMKEITSAATDDAISRGEYMARNMPEFGPLAYEDWYAFTDYMQKAFEEREGGS